MIEEYYTFFWALIGVLAWFVTFLLGKYNDYDLNRVDRKRTQLRDKAHFAHTQNRGCA
jgi:membrane-bound acyltransferase YfiQ involved in biofilm formation